MSTSLDLKSKEEKDAELDKRIEALRRKNQALIQRYQEIEEDRKRAEREGIAVTGARKSRAGEGDLPEKRRVELDSPNLTVQVLVSPEEKRLVSSERKFPAPSKTLPGSCSPRGSARGGPPQSTRPPRATGPPEPPSREVSDAPGGGECDRGGRSRRPRGRRGATGDAGPDRRSKEWEERRRENIEKMNEEMEKIAEYERSQRDGLQEKNPVRNFLDDPRRSGPFAESDRREGSRRHIRNWGGADFEKVKTGVEQGKERPSPGHGNVRRHRPPDMDMTLSMTGRERAEYLRWKQEREQIDRERLERHRQPTGEWRREWDAEKIDTAFKDRGKPRGSEGSRQDESRRPPKAPTFGEFLPERQSERRSRRSRGRGSRQGGPSKPYSMHDIRWEKEEPEPKASAAMAKKEKSDGGTTAQQSNLLVAAPAVPDVEEEEAAEEEEEEEEDQWEDVSEGEEEEEGTGSSQGSLTKGPVEASPAAAAHPKDLGQDGQPLPGVPTPPAETPNPEGKPLSPFLPAEGYHPVPDWGEEMELFSPRADTTQSPLATTGEAPPVLKGSGASTPPAQLDSSLASVEEELDFPRAPKDELQAMSRPEEEAVQGSTRAEAVVKEALELAPGTTEITDLQQTEEDEAIPPSSSASSSESKTKSVDVL